MQLFTTQLIINQNQPDKEEVFNYLCSLISNDARCKREIKSRIFMSKATFKKYSPSLQILEKKMLCATFRDYLCKVPEVRYLGN